MSTPRRSNRSDPLLIACAALPIVGLVVVYGLVLRARIALGEWPSVNRSDPKDLEFGVHGPLAGLLLLVAALSPVALAACLLLRRRDDARVRHRGVAIALFAAGYALLWLLAWTDPGGFIAWYAD